MWLKIKFIILVSFFMLPQWIRRHSSPMPSLNICILCLLFSVLLFRFSSSSFIHSFVNQAFFHKFHFSVLYFYLCSIFLFISHHLSSQKLSFIYKLHVIVYSHSHFQSITRLLNRIYGWVLMLNVMHHSIQSGIVKRFLKSTPRTFSKSKQIWTVLFSKDE